MQNIPQLYTFTKGEKFIKTDVIMFEGKLIIMIVTSKGIVLGSIKGGIWKKCR